jgi:CheY-like chemotaxis protein
VVDDGAINRKVATKLLESLGCQVAAVPSGQKAVELMRGEARPSKGGIAIVFMDIQMPEMDGGPLFPTPLCSVLILAKHCDKKRGSVTLFLIKRA